MLARRGIARPLVVVAILLSNATLSAAPSVMAVSGLTSSPPDAGQQVERINFQVMELTRKGNYSEATALAEANLGSALSVLGNSQPQTDTAIDSLAFLYEMQDRDAEAAQLLAQLAESRALQLGPEHLLTAMVLRRLATVYVRLGRTAAAEAIFRRVIPIFEVQPGPGDWITIAAIRSLALLEDEQGRFEEAESLYRRALAALERSVGRRHEDTASILGDLGSLYARQQKFGDAEPLLLEALEIQNALPGPQSVDASFTRSRLAWAYMEQRRYGDAERIFRQDLQIKERMHGRDHPETARALTSLSYPLAAQNKHAEAEQALTRSVAIFSGVQGPQSTEAMLAAEALVGVYEERGKLEEAASLLHDLIGVQTRQFGAASHETTSLQLRLAWLRSHQGAHDEAETRFQEVLAIRQQVPGAGDQDMLEARTELANFLRTRARYAEAQELFSQTLAENVGADSVAVKDALVGLANVSMEQGRYDDAEAHLERAIGIAGQMADTGRDEGDLSTLYNNLATIYQNQGKYAEAKEALLSSIRIIEEDFGPNSVLVATALQNLASIYTATGDYEAAEPLFGRALRMYRKGGRFHAVETARVLGNLANLYLHAGDLDQADTAIREALELGHSVLGERHPSHGLNLNTAALLAQASGDTEGAERYLRQALAVFQEQLGPQHPHSTRAMSNLGTLLVVGKRFAEAQVLLQNAQVGIEAALGPSHPDTAMAWAALAYCFQERGDPELALPYIRRANNVFQTQPAISERQTRMSSGALGPQSVFTLHLDILAALADTPGQDRTALTDEAFRVGQQMRQTSTARALQRTATRFAAGTDDLARVVREHQDLAAAWKAVDAELTSNLSRDPGLRDSGAEQALRERLAAIQQKLEAIEKRLRLEFPRYAELMHPAPLGLGETQALLGPAEALIAYVAGPQRSYAWLLRKNMAEFHVLDVSARELRDTVAVLRAGLDPQAGRGARRLGLKRSAVGGFDVGLARQLYATIWIPFTGQLDDVEHVVVVPDGALQSLPVAVLVEQIPVDGVTTLEDLRDLDWLVRRHALSQLPAVSSLKALRSVTTRLVPGDSFVGFGDPQLKKGRFPNLRLAPLPESAAELRALARLLDAPDARLYLGGEATERQVRAMNFADVGILAFATHGLMAGELDGLDEPGLVLTPADSATDTDDGFLSASEIAGLELNLDWVILSACNTAASDGTPGGEGLSGLARSFFYAGARSMLVSHWSVYSQAAVDITTGMLQAMAEARDIGRAEALRRSLKSLIEDGENPHPSYWGPFVLVGDGRATRRAAP